MVYQTKSSFLMVWIMLCVPNLAVSLKCNVCRTYYNISFSSKNDVLMLLLQKRNSLDITYIVILTYICYFGQEQRHRPHVCVCVLITMLCVELHNWLCFFIVHYVCSYQLKTVSASQKRKYIFPLFATCLLVLSYCWWQRNVLQPSVSLFILNNNKYISNVP